ncbi:MAG TPA: metallophosphoesterase [Chthoniobacter sp.]|nr:metallophosphoesterase [Chthoniobacter sp.]
MWFFALIFLVLFLGDLVWGWKTSMRVRRLPRPWAGFAMASVIAFAMLQAAGIILLFFGRRLDWPVETLFPKPIIAGVYIWHCLVLLPLAFLWFLWRIAAGVLRIARALSRLKRAETPQPRSENDVSRREFVAASLCTAPALLALGGTGMAAYQWNQFRIRRLTLPLANLPKALDGLTIAQVCDLHVGVFTRGAVLDKIVEATNSLRADLVMLPGDLINYSLSDLPVALDVAKRLEGRHGSFVCEGNHDLFENPEAFRKLTTDAGLRLLVNDTAMLSIRGVPVQVLGLRWGAAYGDPRATSSRGDLAIEGSMKELLTLRQREAFPILLAHHPHAFDFAADIPLTLSGHTHGGQLMLTKDFGFGPAMFRYWSGLYQKADRALVVSNGVGNWFPVRVQAPAEIVHLTLRSV